MKKILLLGDSIRMGYDKYIKEMLNGTCDVYYDADNGRFAAYTLWQVNQMFRKYGSFDLVHWNNGYWDMNIEPPMDTPLFPPDEYVSMLKRIIREIRRNGAKIIFATTTPILYSGVAADTTGTGAEHIGYDNRWVTQYNEVAVRLMQEEQIPVNDLYTLCLRDKNYYKCPDMLHLTEEGYRACAAQAVSMIRRELGL